MEPRASHSRQSLCQKVEKRELWEMAMSLRESFMIESQWLYEARESVLLSGYHEAKVNHLQNLGYAVWMQPPKL